jgi:phenylpropionate dioxygenase-like ring-hydroxylating dioxygenase large terminal subunit
VEKDALFRRHWQIACHISDVPNPGDYISFDMCGERALVMRDKEGEVRAFHNLCRHRGARVLAGDRGECPHVITCPFHGWSYNLDGTLRSPAVPSSLPKLDPVEHGLKPIEMEIWHGFVFLRFLPGDQPSVATIFCAA